MSQRYIGGLIYNPPGGFSGLFDGSGDFLTTPSNAALGFGTGDFIIEAWVYCTSLAATQTINDARTGNTATAYVFSIFSSGALNFYDGPNNTDRTSGSGVVGLNSWTHVLASRSGTTLRLFVNGSIVGTFTGISSDFGSSQPSTIGRQVSGSGEFNGYISNLRIIKNSSVTAAFNPPSGQLQAITNTSLLTCAYSTFRDGSTNNFTITVNGNTAVSTQNPFPLTTLPNPALGNQGNGVYSMSQYQSLLSQNLWPAVDPYWRYVTLMLHGNGTNGAQNNTFLDSSTNNFTITRNGNTTQGTFSPYGSNWSNYTGNAASAATRVDVSGTSGIFGTNVSYTMEGWFNFTADSSGDASNIITYNTNTFPTRWFWDAQITSGTLYLRLYTESNSIVFNGSTVSYTLGTWVHLAVVNNNTANTCTFYVNGVAAGTRAKVSLTAASTLNLLCNSSSVSAATPFYVSNFRIVNNTALYSSNFTPSTSPLTAVSSTALLTFQSNRFVDNSGSNLTLTPYSTNQIQRFSPFNPTAPYAAGTDGGSGYFDGSGDYLGAPSNAAFDFGSGDFTIEASGYRTSSGAYGFLISRRSADSNFGPFSLGVDGSNAPYFACSSSGSSWIFVLTGSALPLNAWFHLAGVRSGNTFTLYVNGVSVGTATSSSSLMASSVGVFVGAHGNGSEPFAGYISNARAVKGTAVYTSNFTPPTAPLTAITNTSLLLNFTNAGIIDNAEMNNLETVGNAQISTAQSKFGGGSMLFDGTGDYLVPNGAGTNLGFVFGTGDFTIEFWVYFISGLGSDIVLYDSRPLSTNGVYPTLYVNSSSQLSYVVSGADRITSGSAFSATQWYHIALCRSGTSTRMFINGVQVGSTYSDSNNYLNPARRPVIAINGFNETAAPLNGYIDDLRITKAARYTTSFTPQRSQWQDQ
jgi:hypothetical protein